MKIKLFSIIITLTMIAGYFAFTFIFLDINWLMTKGIAARALFLFYSMVISLVIYNEKK